MSDLVGIQNCWFSLAAAFMADMGKDIDKEIWCGLLEALDDGIKCTNESSCISKKFSVQYPNTQIG